MTDLSGVSPDTSDVPDIVNDIQEAEETIRRMEKDIRRLWKDVIVPYKQDICRAQILTSLTEQDFDKFHDFMTHSNPTYQKMKKYLDYLQAQGEMQC